MINTFCVIWKQNNNQKSQSWQVYPANSSRLSPTYPFLTHSLWVFFSFPFFLIDEPNPSPLRVSITSWRTPCPPHPQQHTLSTKCWCVGILRSLCGQREELQQGVRVPSKMRGRRWTAGPILGEAGRQQGQSRLFPGNWDTAGGTLLPSWGDDNTNCTPHGWIMPPLTFS